MRLFHEDIRDSLVQAGQKACGYMNCKLFVQAVTGIPKLDDLPSRSFRSVSDLTAGDVLKWGTGQHWAIYIGDGDIMEVEEWGATSRIVSLAEVLEEMDPPDTVFSTAGYQHESLLRKYIRELLNEENVLASGMCFPFAYQKAEEWFESHYTKGARGRAGKKHPDLNNKDKFKVVHGTVTDKWKNPPKPIVHGWVEMGDLVFDSQTSGTKPDGIEKEVYYDMYQPEVYKEFTAEEAILNCAMKGGEGPWDNDLYAMMQDRDAWMKESALRGYVREKLLSEAPITVRGYMKPATSFFTLDEWEHLVNEFLKFQEQGIDTRGGQLPAQLLDMIEQHFSFQLHDQVERWELLTQKNILDFIEDFVNHRFWGIEQEFGQYFEDIKRLKFAYFYSRGDMEPYVLIDDEFTTQLYGSTDNPKELLHYTSESGLARLQEAIDTGNLFDISAFTVAERPFFRPESNLIVKFVGNVRAGFRSDIKSMAVDTGQRACNMYRLQYPGHDMDNICRELDSCDGDVRTSLWNEYIATPIEILSVEVVA